MAHTDKSSSHSTITEVELKAKQVIRPIQEDASIPQQNASAAPSDKPKCAFNRNKYNDILPNDPFGNDKYERETYIEKGSSMKRISREYQKLDRSTMEHKHGQFDHLPADHMGNSRNPSDVYHAMGSSAEKGVSQGYQRLDRRTMESRHETSDDLHADHFGNYRDAGEACLREENAARNKISREYQTLDRCTMESRQKTSED